MFTHQERLEHTLFLLMEHDIARYLMSNTYQRWDGAQKAQHHLALSYTYVACRELVSIEEAMVLLVDEDDYSSGFLYQVVHDATQALTSRMDEVIDFPLEDRHPDHEVLIPLFFRHFVRLADEALLCLDRH